MGPHDGTAILPDVGTCTKAAARGATRMALPMKTGVASRAPSLSRCLLVGALVLAGQPTCASTHVPLPRRADAPASTTASKRMADGREWTTTNSDVDVAGSFCY